VKRRQKEAAKKAQKSEPFSPENGLKKAIGCPERRTSSGLRASKSVCEGGQLAGKGGLKWAQWVGIGAAGSVWKLRNLGRSFRRWKRVRLLVFLAKKSRKNKIEAQMLANFPQRLHYRFEWVLAASRWELRGRGTRLRISRAKELVARTELHCTAQLERAANFWANFFPLCALWPQKRDNTLRAAADSLWDESSKLTLCRPGGKTGRKRSKRATCLHWLGLSAGVSLLTLSGGA